MTTGIIARFRTMDIARVSVLTGHVLGAVIKTGFAVVIVTAFVFLLGFRSDAGPLGWLGAIGLLILTAFSLTWLTVGMGLAADSVETASNTPMFLMILPFISSAFVPTEAMPAGLRRSPNTSRSRRSSRPSARSSPAPPRAPTCGSRSAGAC